MERDRSLSLSLYFLYDRIWIDHVRRMISQWHGDNGERGRCISCFIYTRYTHKENTITLPERVESELQFTMEK